MSPVADSATFDNLEKLGSGQPREVLDRLIAQLRADHDWHGLFDALLMRRRQELGLPLIRPTSLKDVPAGLRDDFEKFYIDSAREVGGLLLADGQIPQAWNYFRAINETEPVARAIEALPADAAVEEPVVEIALFHGVAPIKGLEFFLKSHGTCSTITALDQQFGQMTPANRASCARVMVRRIYEDLRSNVEHDVKRRLPMTPPGGTLRELIAGREMLFADGNYHIDVSHLNSVVRFARMLEPHDSELDLALQLAQYGARLSPQYQYGGNAPFTDFYPAHIKYFQAMLNQNRDDALAWFHSQITGDPADTDTQVAAYVLVDLLIRLERPAEALDLAMQYLPDTAEEFGLSIPELCAKAGKFDKLREFARSRGDLLNFTAGLLSR